MKALLLDVKGFAAALTIGGIIVAFSGQWVAQNLALIALFLLLSVAATKYRYEEKKKWGIYEFERGWQNVLSNGIIAALCPLLSFTGWLPAYVCAVAAAMSDKFGSELGVFGGQPFSLLKLKQVRIGTSGAVSAYGTFFSFVGALLIGLAAYFLFKFDPVLIFFIAAIGFVGSFIDTIAGVAEEIGIGNKHTSNLMCTFSAAVIGANVITW